MTNRSPTRLAVVLSHPTQYYSPWFRHLSGLTGLTIKVFYLWDFGIEQTVDRGFGVSFAWDIPLLDGYEYEFVLNKSSDPGTHHFHGLKNPGITGAISSWSPDAILLFGYTYFSHLRILLSIRLRSIPILFRGDSHILDPAIGLKAGVSKTLRRILFRRLDYCLAVGRANADYFMDSGVPSSSIVNVPHCVDNERFQEAEESVREDAARWRQELKIPDDHLVLLFAGKFEEKKQPVMLLEAYLQLIRKKKSASSHRSETKVIESASKQYPKISLLFVGHGPLEKQLTEIARDEAGKTVFFAPFQNQSQMPMVYAAADIIILPSQGRGETWGLCINEAFNLGIPAIVSSHVGCGPDLVNHGETGWVFEAGNSDSLHQVLKEAISDRQRLHKMGTAAKRHIENFSYESASNSLMQVIERLPPHR